MIAIDTCVFIYQWEANQHYWPLADLIFSSVEQSDLYAVSSTVTMAELLVHPYRKTNASEAQTLFGLFAFYPNLKWIAPDLETAAGARTASSTTWIPNTRRAASGDSIAGGRDGHRDQWPGFQAARGSRRPGVG